MKQPKNFAVQVGGYYVGGEGKEYLIRHIVGTTMTDVREMVCWESYKTDTGEATRDSGACSQGAIIDWAGREATPEEIARLVKTEPTYQQESTARMLTLFLHHMPDQQLLAEAERRGYRLVKDEQ